jgi:ABC-2 type transport system ATP-binding protein
VQPDPIRVHALTKAYGSVQALAHVDFEVHAGEVVGFLGRNGAGKSTTIRILMGITRPTSGEVSMFGVPLGRDVVEWRRKIGYVAQEQSFYGWMTPVSIGRFVRGFFPTWDDAEYKRLIASMDLPPARKIQTFSGGMKVKLALCLALAHRPPLLLLDEPTAGLDPVARREFLEIVRDEQARSGRTTFFSSHLVDEIELVSQRVAIVDQGRTRYEGTIDALLERVRSVQAPPENEDALRAEVESCGGRVLARGPRGETVIELPDAAAVGTLGARTELGRVPLEEAFIAMVRHRRPS